MTSPHTSASYQIFWPIRCSLVSDIHHWLFLKRGGVMSSWDYAKYQLKMHISEHGTFKASKIICWLASFIIFRVLKAVFQILKDINEFIEFINVFLPHVFFFHNFSDVFCLFVHCKKFCNIYGKKIFNLIHLTIKASVGTSAAWYWKHTLRYFIYIYIY